MLPVQPPPSLPPPAAAPALAWIRKPTLDEVRAVYPPALAAQGVGGTGVIACLVQPDQTLTACQVLAETPKETGFGEAALALTPLMRVQAQAKPGAPLPGVSVPIRFDPPVPVSDATPATPPIAFTAAPDTARLAAAFPKAAKAKAGQGLMRCTVSTGALTGCTIAGDDPAGFSRAAVRLAPAFSVARTLADGRSSDGLILNIPVAFGAEAVTTLVGPQWTERPTAGQVAASFPVQARDRGVGRVAVKARCEVAADGGLEGCRLSTEDPVGVGGARAAARLFSVYRLSVWSGEGRPIAGAAVDLEIVLTPDAAASVQPSAKG